MTEAEEVASTIDERVWAYIVKHRQTAEAKDIALNCDITETEANAYLARISSLNWRTNVVTREHNVGSSDYATRTIQPWDIWLEYELNPWDADIVKRVLRIKAGERKLDYEKIKHVCDERIRQLDKEIHENANVAGKESDHSQVA